MAGVEVDEKLDIAALNAFLSSGPEEQARAGHVEDSSPLVITLAPAAGDPFRQL